MKKKNKRETKRMKKMFESLRGFMGHQKNEYYMGRGSGSRKREERKVTEGLLKEIVVEIFTNLGKEMNIQI